MRVRVQFAFFFFEICFEFRKQSGQKFRGNLKTTPIFKNVKATGVFRKFPTHKFLYFTERLAEISGLTVVTNSTDIARTVSSSGAHNRTFLLGGEFSSDNRQTVGTMVAAQIRSFRAHHAVLTIGALDGRTGAMDFNIEEAQVARAMIEQSESLTVLAESSKFDTIASFEVCPLARIARLVCEIGRASCRERV